MPFATSSITTFFLRILASWSARQLPPLRINLRFLPGRRLARYRDELASTVRAMPFIYQGLEGEVLSDYVDVEMQSLDLATLQLKPINRLKPDSAGRLRDNERILFLGNAGVGKTTFQRYVILSLLRGPDERFVYRGIKPIPVYIPLKAIDNSAPFPIARYLLTNNSLFAGEKGAKRLAEMAQTRRPFFFLDGYDEIPFSGSEKNFVQEELSLIFLGRSHRVSRSNLSDSVVDAISQCRVWLSSRREFFERNPLGTLGSGKGLSAGRGLIAVELRGVETNRMALAKVIFDKYRRQSPSHGQILSEEYFISNIDLSGDPEMRRLSFNPLFLTIMCYIYAQRAIEGGTHAVDWSSKFDDLILECIRLLLRDLDEHKARDLPPAHKEGLLNRRNAFLLEKQAFLEFFSAQLFFEAFSVFDLSSLKRKVRYFFDNEWEGENGRLILEDLDRDISDRPNFALQLIFSGVFVTVDKAGGSTLYDFPHRRFREVLASKYIATPERYLELLTRLDEKQFSEFLGVFLASRWFNDIAFQVSAAELILSEALRNSKERDWGLITERFLTRKPKDYKPGAQIRHFVRDALAFSSPRFTVSVTLLSYLEFDDELLSLVEATFNASLEKAELPLLAFCCELLLYYNRPLLREWLRRELERDGLAGPAASILIQSACLTDPRLLLPYADEIAGNDESLLRFSYYTGMLWPRIKEAREVIASLLEAFPRSSLLYFFNSLAIYSPSRYEEFQSMCRFDVGEDLYRLVVDLSKSAKKGIDLGVSMFCHAFTESNVASLRRYIFQLRLPAALKVEATEKRGPTYAEIGVRLRDELLKRMERLEGSIYNDPAAIRTSVAKAFSNVIRIADFKSAAEFKPIRSSPDEAESMKQLGERRELVTSKFIEATKVSSALVQQLEETNARFTHELPELLIFFD